MLNARLLHCCEGVAYALRTPSGRLWAYSGLAFLLWCPGLGGELKQSMLTHMGLQLSLLVIAGHGMGRAALDLRPGLREQVRPYRWAGLLLAVFTGMVWMIPRLLDAAVERPSVDALKVVSLVFLTGLALAWSWPQLPAVGRGVLHLEVLATVWRLGWLYLDSPTRLCISYGLDDQQRLGRWYLAAGGVYALWLLMLALRDHGSSAPVSGGVGFLNPNRMNHVHTNH